MKLKNAKNHTKSCNLICNIIKNINDDPSCFQKFPTRAELLTHITRHDWDETKHKYSAKLVKADDGTYLCTICNKKFINRAPANAHVFRHMNLIEGLFVCKTCGLV